MTFAVIIDKFAIIQKLRINNQITVPELRVLDEKGSNLGTMNTDAALSLAKEKGLDLIEVSPSAKPPVARIMSFDKFRYQQEKKEKQQKGKQKGGELKQIQISIGEAKHDLERKAQKVNEFLEEGNRVEIMMVLRGREKGNKDWALGKLKEFLKIITPEHQVIMAPRFTGRGFAAQISQ